MTNDVHLRGLQLIGGRVEDAYISVDGDVHHAAAADWLNSGNVAYLGRNYRRRFDNVKDRETATDFARCAAGTGYVDVGAGRAPINNWLLEPISIRLW